MVVYLYTIIFMLNWTAIENTSPQNNNEVIERNNEVVKENKVIDKFDSKQDFIKNMGQEFKDKYWKDFDIDTYHYIVNNILVDIINKFWEKEWFEIFKTYLKESISNIRENYKSIFLEKKYIIINEDIIERYFINKKQVKEEEWRTKEEEWRTKEEEWRTKEEEWRTKEEESIHLKEIEKERIKDIEERMDYLGQLHEWFDAKYKIDEKSLDLFKQEELKREPWILKKLEGWQIIQEKINQYFKYLFTAQKLLEDNEAPIENKYEFIKSFNDLNKSLGIDIQLEMEAYFADQKKKFKIDIFAKKQSISLVALAEWERILDNKEFQKFKNSQKHNIENIDLGKNKKSILELYSNDKKNLTQIIDYINDDWSINEQKIDEIIKNPDEKSKIIKNLNSQIKESLDTTVQIKKINNRKIRVISTDFLLNAVYWTA